MWKYTHTDELYHYGIPGMKWGHKKGSAVRNAYDEFKRAKKAEKAAKKDYRKGNIFGSAGYEKVKSNEKKRANIQRLSQLREKAAFKIIDAKAKAAYDKKLAKTGNVKKAEKASFKVHNKAFKKEKYGAGLHSSIADAAKGGGNSRYIEHIRKTKGKDYANKMEKKMRTKAVATVAAGTAYLVGTAAYNYYKNR